MTDDETTSPDGPSAFRIMLDGQKRLEVMIGHLTNETVGMRADVSSLLSRVGLLEIRVSALELAGKYLPLIVSTAALSIAIWSAWLRR